MDMWMLLYSDEDTNHWKVLFILYYTFTFPWSWFSNIFLSNAFHLLTCIFWVPNICCVCVCVCPQSCPTPCNHTDWDFPGKNAGAGCHFLLQGIFLTQGSNPCLLHLLRWQVDSLPLVQGLSGLLSSTQKWTVWRDTRADKVIDFIGKRRLGGEQQGKGTQESCSVSGFMVMGFVSGLSLVSHFDPGSFLVMCMAQSGWILGRRILGGW